MAAGIDTAFLRSSDLFENQPEEVLRAVLLQGQLQEYGPGEVVFGQGDEGDRLYIVKSGALEVLATPSDVADPIPVAYLGPGEVLGELILAIKAGTPLRTLAEVIHPYPAFNRVLGAALQDLAAKAV